MIGIPLPWAAGLAAILMAVAAGTHHRGAARLADCQRAAATEALGYERLLLEREQTIMALRADIERQGAATEAARQAALLAGSRAAQDALRALQRPRTPVTGHGPEEMERWLASE